MKEFINFDKMYDTINSIYADALNEIGCNDETYYDIADDMAYYSAQDAVDSMRKYVHQKDTRMDGNFCNIREDWEVTTDFVHSEVQPWGKFADMVRSMDEDSISEDDAAKVQQWCMDWYFTAFGVWGVKYNFQTWISELEYETEREVNN